MAREIVIDVGDEMFKVSPDTELKVIDRSGATRTIKARDYEYGEHKVLDRPKNAKVHRGPIESFKHALEKDLAGEYKGVGSEVDRRNARAELAKSEVVEEAGQIVFNAIRRVFNTDNERTKVQKELDAAVREDIERRFGPGGDPADVAPPPDATEAEKDAATRVNPRHGETGQDIKDIIKRNRDRRQAALDRRKEQFLTNTAKPLERSPIGMEGAVEDPTQLTRYRPDEFIRGMSPGDPAFMGGPSNQGENVLITYERGPDGRMKPVYRRRPQYYAGDEKVPEGRNGNRLSRPEDIARVQRQLVKAGLLVEAFNYGVWDLTSQTAYSAAMSYANQEGVSVWNAIDVYKKANEKNKIPKYQPPEFKPEPFRPDMDKIKNTVFDMFERQLNRAPRPEEVEQLAGMMRGEFRKQYDRELAAARREYEHEVMLSEYEHVTGAMTGAEQTVAEETGKMPQFPTEADTVVDPNAEPIDPAEKVLARFNERFQEEKGFIQRQGASQRQHSVLQSGFEGLRQALLSGTPGSAAGA